jgi:CRP/FNR family cyclic AMP-dependent transcriptional regulator
VEPDRNANTEFRVRGHFERFFEAGETVFEEGDPGDCLYIIQSGAIELTRLGPDGVRPLENLGPGDFFGEMSVVLGGTRSVRARALSPTRVLELDSSTLQEMCLEQPEIAIRLIRRLAGRVIDLEKQVFALGADDLLRLVVRALLRRAKRSGQGARIPATLRQIAEDAGLPLFEVHQALQKLFDRKLVRLRDEVLYTPDRSALENLIEPS